MCDDQRKGRQRETIGDRYFLDVGGTDDFRVEFEHGIIKIPRRNRSGIPLANKDRNDLAGTNIEHVKSLTSGVIKDRVILCRPLFGDVPLCQGARVQVERARHSYSSRISMMPRLNSFPSGSMPDWIIRSRSSLAPIG